MKYSKNTPKYTKKELQNNGIEMSPLNDVNETKPVAHIGKFKLWAQSFTSLMADLCQDINRVSLFSRCLNGTFP